MCEVEMLCKPIPERVSRGLVSSLLVNKRKPELSEWCLRSILLHVVLSSQLRSFDSFVVLFPDIKGIYDPSIVKYQERSTIESTRGVSVGVPNRPVGRFWQSNLELNVGPTP
jgi:hypothetical protein